MSTTPKIALVTGANKGIGKEIAKQLAAEGVTVLLASRNLENGQAAALELSGDIRAVQLDVTNAVSIENLKAHIEAEYGRLDVLVNNAGIALDMAPASQSEIDILRNTFETNFFGVFNVTKALLPLIQKSEAGRIVNMSSELGSLALCGDPNWEFAAINPFAYGASKTALNAFTVSLAKELRDTPIKVNSVTPGYTATELNNFQGHRTVEEGAREPVRLALLPEDGPTGGFFDDNGELGW